MQYPKNNAVTMQAGTRIAGWTCSRKLSNEIAKSLLNFVAMTMLPTIARKRYLKLVQDSFITIPEKRRQVH